MHSARVIYYAMYTQRVFRKGLFITQYIRSEHSERHRGPIHRARIINKNNWL